MPRLENIDLPVAVNTDLALAAVEEGLGSGEADIDGWEALPEIARLIGPARRSELSFHVLVFALAVAWFITALTDDGTATQELVHALEDLAGLYIAVLFALRDAGSALQRGDEKPAGS
jgi:hypothetical protein